MRRTVPKAGKAFPALVVVAILLATGCHAPVRGRGAARKLPMERPAGHLEPFRLLSGYMPTGVAVSQQGRVFCCFPRWEEGLLYTVGEVKPDGTVVAYPDLLTNQPDPQAPTARLFSVQSVAVDALDRLWLLDTGRLTWGKPPEAAAKLVAVDLHTGEVARTVTMPPEVMQEGTYLNDVRLDLRKGGAGYAYITDSGRGGILVVDLDNGQVVRRLAGHPSVQPADIQLIVEGRPLHRQPKPGADRSPFAVSADGIALSPNGETLYYCPLTSRRLYSVPAAALRDPQVGDEALGAMVEDLGPKPACDGIVMDQEGRLYLSAFEHNAILRRSPDGTLSTIAHDRRLLWPDTFAIGPDGWLYVTANQLHRQPAFNQGADLRKRPFVIFRTRIDAGPVLLK